ncbi:RING-H2 zinc finger domain [Fragilaria crotonensis]|nr:RING-H2 zinc finger domain [Fragilaria crotonensis]
MKSSSLTLPLSLSLPEPAMPSTNTPKESNSKIQKRSRIRRRPVTFGNPALGTYEGFVFTLEDLRNETFDDLLLPPDIGSSSSLDCVAAMIHVPPEQVPEGVLHLARAHQRQIKHARILISSLCDDDDEGCGGIATVSDVSPPSTSTTQTTTSSRNWKKSKSELIDIKHSPLSTRTYRRSSSSDDVVVPSPSASAAQSAAAIFAADPSPQLMTSEKNSSRNRSLWRNELTQKNHQEAPPRSYLVLFVLSSPHEARQFVQDLNNKPYTTLDETQVAQVHHVVGLEGDAQHGIVSLLSPTFGAANESRNRSNDNSDEPGVLITTVCNHSFHWACLWRCKDSPCPVCRYDHASLNETLSQCHICSSTEHNYVCLICGVISCTNSSAATKSGSSTASSLGHARQHYDDTLHAYALDTETQHVWDFCGQGYVHRLLQNSSDGKLVEVSNQHDNQRLPEAGRLSDAQEDEVVHRKLEGFAQQYYTLLKSQLEEQRAYYEGQLEELLRGIKESQFRSRSASSSSSETLIAALKQERRQLQHRLSTLQDRYQKVADEVSFLKNLNESLETNKEQMRRQIQEAQRERNEARQMIQQSLPPLEFKVHALMLQLEQQGEDEDSDSKMAAK